MAGRPRPAIPSHQTQNAGRTPAFLFSRCRFWGCVSDDSGAGAAADIDHVAVTGRGVLVHEAGDQHPSVERDDFAILFAARRSRRADIVLAALAALQPQLLG